MTTLLGDSRAAPRIGFLIALVFLAPDSVADSTSIWGQQTIRDLVHRGGEIINAQATSTSGALSLDTWLRCWTATGLRDARLVLHKHGKELSGDVAWWFDRDKIHSAKWRVGPSGDSVVVPDQIQAEFVRLLRSRQQLHVRLTDSASEILEFSISLSGSDRAIMDVVTCKRSGSRDLTRASGK